MSEERWAEDGLVHFVELAEHAEGKTAYRSVAPLYEGVSKPW